MRVEVVLPFLIEVGVVGHVVVVGTVLVEATEIQKFHFAWWARPESGLSQGLL